MTDTTKKYLFAAIAAIIALLGWLAIELGGSAPTPQPSASPSASVSDIPSPTSVLEIKGVVGETVGMLWASTISGPVPNGIKAYEVLRVETLIPSFKGAVVGFHEDPLQPVTSFEIDVDYWVEAFLSAQGDICFGGGLTGPCFMLAHVKAGPMKTMPFYMELSFDNVGKAHNLPDTGPNLKPRAALNKLYRSLLREHGVEPIKQAITGAQTLPIKNGLLDFDSQYAGSGGTFRETVLTGAIYPPMIVGPNISTPSALFLDALKATVVAGLLPVGSWSYAWDEGEGTADAQALARAQLLKPTGLKIMETRNVTAPFQPFVDQFYPVVSHVQPNWVLGGAYTSCMANGNCQNHTSISQVADATGDPMLVLDASPVHARAFPWVLSKLGAPRGLYFMANKLLATAWNSGGQYNEGGNGDGTMLYAGSDGNPWPSLRLKRLYRGLQDQWYLSQGGLNPVKASRDWPKDESVYESERLRVWETLH